MAYDQNDLKLFSINNNRAKNKKYFKKSKKLDFHWHNNIITIFVGCIFN